MFLDALHNYSDQQALAGGAGVDVNSTNVHDAGAAVKLFEGDNPNVIAAVDVTAAGGTTPDLRARFVGADDAVLTSNVITLGDTGVFVIGTAPNLKRVRIQRQTTAKRYYGFIFVQSGANHTATVNAQLTGAAQSRMTP